MGHSFPESGRQRPLQRLRVSREIDSGQTTWPVALASFWYAMRRTGQDRRNWQPLKRVTACPSGRL